MFVHVHGVSIVVALRTKDSESYSDHAQLSPVIFPHNAPFDRRQSTEPGWGSPRAFACVELKWPCDGSSGWSVPTSGVSSNLLRNDVPGSRIKVHREHSRMPPAKWVSPVTLTRPGRGASNDKYGADLYQTSPSTAFPAKPDRVDRCQQNPQQSPHLRQR